MIPSVIGMAATRVNYDMLTYLPEDIETVIGQNELLEDFNKGAFTLRDSSNTLVAGVQQLKDGAGQLYNGLGTLADGTKTLHSGAQELTEGGLELRDGMRKFYEEGITKLSETIMETVPDMLSRLRAILRKT